MKKYVKPFYAIVCIASMFFLMVSLQSCSYENEIEADTDLTDDETFVPDTKDTTFANAVVITYSGTTATVVNPFESSGVGVVVSAGDVTVTSAVSGTEINYVLSGITGDGSLKLYSDYKYNLVLNGVSITNDDGPAISIQSGKKASVNVLEGTNNKLVDGTSYAVSEEDQKGTFFSEGQLVFGGTGTLTVVGKYKHGIVSDDYVRIEEGNIFISSAASDGIHASDYFKMEGGTLTVQSSGDGIDVEEGYVEITAGAITVSSVDDGITASYDGTDTAIIPYVEITGGEIEVTTTGDKAHALRSRGNITVNSNEAIVLSSSGKAADGISADGNVVITDGDIIIATSGAAFYDSEDSDVASADAVNSDGDFSMVKGTLDITSTGTGGKGISADGMISVAGGTINIGTTGAKFVYSSFSTEAKAIKGDGAVVIQDGSINISSADDGIKSDVSVTINGGAVVISKSTEGIEAPLITFNAGNVSIVSSDDSVNGTKGNGGESNDNSLVSFAGGVISLNSSGGDPVDSNGNVLMTGGTVVVQGPPSSPEVALDYNGTFKISGGFLIASGPNAGGMIEATSTSSTQYTVLVKVNGNVAANSIFNIQDASGNSLVTFRPLRSAYYFVFSSPALQSGVAYKVYTGGSVAGGTNTNGLITDGIYSGGTQKGSLTVNSKVTTSAL